LKINQIYNIRAEQGLKNIKSLSVDFILTDPPYNVGLDYDIYKDDLSTDAYIDWCYEWINELHRVLKQHHYAIIFNGDNSIYPMLKAIERTEFVFHHFLKWYKPNAHSSIDGTVMFYKTELAVVLSNNKPDINLINKQVMFADTVICNANDPSVMSFYHPASRPVKLYSQIINGFTNEGDLVLDCFMGSGTTAIACKELGRNYIGFELSQDYIDIANKRLSKTKYIPVKKIVYAQKGLRI